MFIERKYNIVNKPTSGIDLCVWTLVQNDKLIIVSRLFSYVSPYHQQNVWLFNDGQFLSVTLWSSSVATYG